MAVLTLAQAKAKLISDELAPIEAALNAYLSAPARVDYFNNTTHDNHVVHFRVAERDIDANVNISEASKEALAASITTAGWFSVTVQYLADVKRLEVTFAEKDLTAPVEPEGGA